jgi:phosphonopyruvate decarboxylase
VISPDTLLDALASRGFTFFSGCGRLRGLIAASEARGEYLAATSEGAALAIASGATLGGRKGVVIAQNSGLGNIVNPLASVLLPARVPVLMLLSMRGWPDPDLDEPEHAVMGPATPALLETLGVPYETMGLDSSAAALPSLLDRLQSAWARGAPAALLVEPGAITAADAPTPPAEGSWSSAAAIEALVPFMEESVVYATAGYTSRQVHALADRPLSFYVQGGMGHALGMALGTALARPDRTVFVLDGDGALLMHLGTAATVARTAPRNFFHILLDNGEYESTGGQAVPSDVLSWQQLAGSLGYSSIWSCTTRDEMHAAMAEAQGMPGPHFLCLSVQPRAGPVPPRPSSSVDLPDLTDRFTAALEVAAVAAGATR